MGAPNQVGMLGICHRESSSGLRAERNSGSKLQSIALQVCMYTCLAFRATITPERDLAISTR